MLDDVSGDLMTDEHSATDSTFVLTTVTPVVGYPAEYGAKTGTLRYRKGAHRSGDKVR